MLFGLLLFILVVFVVFNGIFLVIHLVRKKNELDFLQNQAATQLHSEKIETKNYVGLWYELALLPNSFQSDCIGSTAQYAYDGSDNLSVVNTCYRKDLPTTFATGVARPYQDAKEYQDRWLKVAFFASSLPSFYSNLFSGDYLILHAEKLENDSYDLAIIGSIDKKYLWILSRKPQVSSEKLNSLLKIAAAKGYDLSKLVVRDSLVYK